MVPTTNYSVNALPFTATPLSTSDPAVFTVIPYGDQTADPVPLGTNHFNFYGGDYTDTPDRYYLWASAKGILTIYNPDTGFGNTDLTTAPNVPTIAALWSDWNKPPGATPMVVAKMDVADNLLIVQWNDIVHFGGNGQGVSFQVVLQLNTGTTPGTITVNYFNIDTGDQNANGGTSTIGLKDWGPQGPSRLLVSQNALNPLIGSNKSIQFTWGDAVPQPTISGLSQESAAEESPDLTVTVDGSDFVANSVVQMNGAAVPTTFLSSAQLQTTIPATALTEEGTVNLTVYNPGSPGKTSDPHVFTIFDALLSAQVGTVASVEGQPLANVVVGSFTDPGSDGTITDYTATVKWTDGSGQSNSAPGSIQAVDGHTFNVIAESLGSLTEEGSYAIGIAIADRGGSNAAAQGVVNITDAPLTAKGLAASATTGLAFTGLAARFSDGNPNAQASDFTATICWGDGQSSLGTVTADGQGGFLVTGTNTFANAGDYAVGVQIADIGGAATSTQSTVNVADSIPDVTAQVVQSRFLLGRVRLDVSFTDLVAKHHKAVINWGDGTHSRIDLGVSASGSFSLKHFYRWRFMVHHRSADITVTIIDDDGTTSAPDILPVDFRHHGFHR